MKSRSNIIKTILAFSLGVIFVSRWGPHEKTQKLQKQRLDVEEKGETKDIWDKLKTVSTIVASVAAIFGSIAIPYVINEQNIESSRDKELSALISNLMADSSYSNMQRYVVAMTSYDSYAVPPLLLLLNESVEIEDIELTNVIVSALKRVGRGARKHIQAQLSEEIGSIGFDSFTEYKATFIAHLFAILGRTGISSQDCVRITENYFDRIRDLDATRSRSQRISNASALRFMNENCLSKRTKKINFSGLNLTGSDLRNIDFSGFILDKAVLNSTLLYGVSFDGASLSGTNLQEVAFFPPYLKSGEVVEIFIDFSKTEWKEASLDEGVTSLLEAIESEANEEELIILVEEVIEETKILIQDYHTSVTY